MEQSFKRIGPGLYEREYVTATGESSKFYYGRLKYNGKRPLFALGPLFRSFWLSPRRTSLANRWRPYGGQENRLK